MQAFSTTSSTGIAQVEVVDASPPDPGELQVGDLQTADSAAQDEKQLEVTGRIDNANTTEPLAADVVYGLEEDVDPAFAGADLLGQTAPNVAVPAGGSANVTFFVDLTEEDEPINTGDDIRQGIDVLGNNITQPLTITDGPIDHSEDGGATLNRTTGLIQTAVDISSDADDDVVTVNPRGSPYNENVTVPVDNIVIQGNTSQGKPIVSWVGPQAPTFDPDPPFTVENTAENTTIRDLRIDPLIPNAGGFDILGGTNHNVLNNDVTGTNTGAPGVGVDVSSVIGANVSSNEIANKSNGVVFDSVSDGVMRDNLIRDNSRDGIRLQNADNNNATGNIIRDNDDTGVRLSGSSASNNNITDNVVRGNGADGTGDGIALFIDSSDNLIAGNNVTGTAGNGIGVAATANGNNVIEANNVTGNNGGIAVNSNDNAVTDNDAHDNNGDGIRLRSASGNDVLRNTANNNGRFGIWLQDGSTFNNVTDNLAEGNQQAGIYVGGISGFSNDNTLVNNTARGSVYGIWVRNSENNDVSKSLAENNDFGIEFEEDGFGFSSLEESGNTFTNDTSRNNNWDFVVETSGGGGNGVLLSVSALPVTNLDIGASTNSNTTLSFNANDMELRSVSTPQPDPSDATNISRYFEAQQPVRIAAEGEDVITPQSGVPFLNVSLSYDDPGDLGTVDETTLELRRFNTTASEWQTVAGSTRDTVNDLVSANITQFSNFGAFGDGEGDVGGGGGDAGGECINRRDLSRGQEDQECPFDRDISRGGSREGLDRDTGRGGTGEHRDSATSRRNRGRGSGDRGR